MSKPTTVTRRYSRTKSQHEIAIAHSADGKFASPDGNPKDGKVLGARVPQALVDAVEEDIQRRGMTKAEWIRAAYELMLAQGET